MTGKCIKCVAMSVKFKTEMQAFLMDHVKMISRIQKIISFAEDNERMASTVLHEELPDEVETRSTYDSGSNEEDEVIIDLDTDEETDIYECERCNIVLESKQGLKEHLELHYPNMSNDVAVTENNTTNGNEQEDEPVTDVESDQSEIDEQEEHDVELSHAREDMDVDSVESQHSENNVENNYSKSLVNDQEDQAVSESNNVQCHICKKNLQRHELSYVFKIAPVLSLRKVLSQIFKFRVNHRSHKCCCYNKLAQSAIL